MGKDSDLDTIKTDDLSRLDDPAVQAFMEHAQSLTVEDPEAVQARILNNLLTAKSADDVLNAGGVTPAEELIGVPLTVMGIRAANSEFEDGPDLYLHVDAKIVSNGDSVTFATGARDVLFKLVRLDQLGMFPTEVVMVKAKKATKKGYFPTFLARPEQVEEPF